MNTLVLLIALAVLVRAEHLQVGNVANRVVLGHHEDVKYNPILFMKRVKYFFYSSPSNKIIQGILALDQLHSKASIDITAGGVGYPFVNMCMKSERGRGLLYNVGIYFLPDLQYRSIQE